MENNILDVDFSFISEKDELSDVLIKSTRYFFAGTSFPPDLLQEFVLACKSDENVLPAMLENVFCSPLVSHFPVAKKFQRHFFKKLLRLLEESDCEVPDKLYDIIAGSMCESDEERNFCHKIYLPEDLSENRALAIIQESVLQLSRGTTGLSVWQASCDLANLMRTMYLENKTVVELGAGCGLAGIATAAFFPTSTVYLTDFDENVIDRISSNIEINRSQNSTCHNAHVKKLDWKEGYDLDESTFGNVDVVIAADVVYDRELLRSLCVTVRRILETSRCSYAIFASTLRDSATLDSFLETLGKTHLIVFEVLRYQNSQYTLKDGISIPSETIFPFCSSFDSPTIFHKVRLSPFNF
ncbi:unnamed protein product [Caenorhabditis auriculariae]|uniref:FAM86 N-terminal domain-containing protein n=1 Tax=Caenorhabditis auriculariae TaxID=2777116 RepID=A0A8S1H8L1_9PELO|nr:unnamed protein product [Caenorhabditis auriculariae]